MDQSRLQTAVMDACTQDIRAFKPGNVSIGFPMHDMNAKDFVKSAVAIITPITQSAYSVGQRIEFSVEATHRVVSCNTNLGIVLLFAPVLRALERLREDPTLDSLQKALHRELTELSVEDAQACYRAIRLAAPGGLGASKEQDVLCEPSINLFEAMRLAANWDQIAQEYTQDYAGVFGMGVQSLMRSKEKGEAELWAITRCYLDFVANQPDTHVSRRHGLAVAQATQDEARHLLEQWEVCGNAAEVWPDLLQTHRHWRENKINPGTSADLVVASILIMRLVDANSYNGTRH
jgi:triphosphoribosyl-dephospho-CoA synthase